jgi:hypothetical protein
MLLTRLGHLGLMTLVGILMIPLGCIVCRWYDEIVQAFNRWRNCRKGERCSMTHLHRLYRLLCWLGFDGWQGGIER